MLLNKLKAGALQDLGGTRKEETILVRMTAEQKNAICKASAAVDVTPPTLVRAIITKFLEEAGYFERPETWELHELSGFLKDTRNESSCTEKG